MRALLDSPDTFLTRYHRHHAGITSWALRRGRVRDELSSYDLLANVVPSNTSSKVLDIGCGDGYLLERLLARSVSADRIIGLDMSPDELTFARKRPGVDDAELLCEKASAMSLADTSVGYTLAHLSLHVMSQIGQVIAELARVLEPGGLFSAIVPRPDAELSGATAIFFELFNEMYQGQSLRVPDIGDPRTTTKDGVHELFTSEAGFGAIEIVDVELHLDSEPIDVWNTLSARYESYVILPRHRADLRVRFIASTESLLEADGTLPCALPLRQITCRRGS